MASDSTATSSPEFPCVLTLTLPFPSARLATVARRALAVDAELSPLVRRSLATADAAAHPEVLEVTYAATTHRMLRVAVNGFFESLRTVVQVMEELDVDVVGAPGREGLEGVQGVVRG